MATRRCEQSRISAECSAGGWQCMQLGSETEGGMVREVLETRNGSGGWSEQLSMVLKPTGPGYGQNHFTPRIQMDDLSFEVSVPLWKSRAELQNRHGFVWSMIVGTDLQAKFGMSQSLTIQLNYFCTKSYFCTTCYFCTKS